MNNALSYYLFNVINYEEGFVIYDVFAIVELACFLIYIKQIIQNKKLAKYLPLVFVVFLIFNIIDYFFLRTEESFNSIASGVEAIIIIVFCLYYFYEQLKETSTLLIYETHNFWIIIAFLIFFSGTFFLYIYTENTIKDKTFLNQYAIINSGFYLLKNILFSVAMLMKPKKKPQFDFPIEGNIADWNSIRSF